MVHPAKERIAKRTIWIFFLDEAEIIHLSLRLQQKILISIQCDHSPLFDWERKTKSLSYLFCCLGKGERVRLIEYTRERERAERVCSPFPPPYCIPWYFAPKAPPLPFWSIIKAFFLKSVSCNRRSFFSIVPVGSIMEKVTPFPRSHVSPFNLLMRGQGRGGGDRVGGKGFR